MSFSAARLFRRFSLALFIVFCLSVLSRVRADEPTHNAEPQSAVLPPSTIYEMSMDKIEIARLRLHNISNGEIEGSRDGGKSWQLLGHILQPTKIVNKRGFTASKYAAPATVCATAVNAIHLKVGNSTTEKRGIIWSLAPQSDSAAGRVSLQSEVSPGSFAQTDILGGSGIFGGPFTPFVGNPILLDKQRDNVLTALPQNYVPKIGDSWTILIQRPRRYPREITFENRFGGLVKIQYRGEAARIIGQVSKPVGGVGRFIGSYFSEVGRLRANHNGVIDVSTSPRGYIGSFQIVPSQHANEPELSYIQISTQWMVVGPVSVLEPSQEGIAPLFSSYLRPRFDVDDLKNPDVVEGLAGRFLFEVKLRNAKNQISDWQPMPTFWLRQNEPLPNWAKTCLANMTELRIRFPFTFDERASDRVLDVGKTIADESEFTISNRPDPKKLDTIKYFRVGANVGF